MTINIAMIIRDFFSLMCLFVFVFGSVSSIVFTTNFVSNPEKQ